jgi:hypothetical protein
MDNKTIALLATAFVALIVGVSLLGVISTEEQSIVKYTDINNESISLATARAEGGVINTTGITVANAPSGWKASGECPISSVVVKNQSESTLTSGTDYNVTVNTGIIIFHNTEDVNDSAGTYSNSTFVYYEYCSDDYINSSWARTVLDTVPGFFAIALLLISVGIFYGILRKEGLLNRI